MRELKRRVQSKTELADKALSLVTELEQWHGVSSDNQETTETLVIEQFARVARLRQLAKGLDWDRESLADLDELYANYAADVHRITEDIDYERFMRGSNKGDQLP